MTALAIIIAGITSLILYSIKVRLLHAWIVGSTVVPVFVLFAEFILAYQGGGASMWPTAIIIGGALGAISSSIGVVIGKFIK